MTKICKIGNLKKDHSGNVQENKKVPSHEIHVHNQIDLAATLSCLFNLPMPDQNTGIAFINDLHAYWESNNTNSYKQAFECLRRNFEQLSETLGFDDNNLLDKLVTKFERILDDAAKLGELNREFESLIKAEMKTKQLDEKIDGDQSYFMMVSIFWILFVS